MTAPISRTTFVHELVFGQALVLLKSGKSLGFVVNFLRTQYRSLYLVEKEDRR